MEQEIWKDITGYENLYQVSNMGRVKRLKDNSIKKSFLRKKSPFYNVRLVINGRKKNFSIHRLVATCFVPNPEKRLQVFHIDGNIENNKATNIQWKIPIVIHRKGLPDITHISGEEWKNIEGYIGLYQISSFGRIKSLPKVIGKNYNRGETILKLIINKKGYCTISLHKNKKLKSFRVHRIVAKAFIPNPENKPDINHLDFIKTNNHFSNIEWCTVKENNDHAYKGNRVTKINYKKRQKQISFPSEPLKGEQVGTHKYTSEQIIKARTMWATKQYTQQQIANMLGFNKKYLKEIIARRFWKHI